MRRGADDEKLIPDLTCPSRPRGRADIPGGGRASAATRRAHVGADHVSLYHLGRRGTRTRDISRLHDVRSGQDFAVPSESELGAETSTRDERSGAAPLDLLRPDMTNIV